MPLWLAVGLSLAGSSSEAASPAKKVEAEEPSEKHAEAQRLQNEVAVAIDNLETEIAALATVLGLMPSAIVDGTAVTSLQQLVVQMQVRAAESDASIARQAKADADATAEELGAKGRMLIQEVPESLLINPPFLKEIERDAATVVTAHSRAASPGWAAQPVSFRPLSST